MAGAERSIVNAKREGRRSKGGREIQDHKTTRQRDGRKHILEHEKQAAEVSTFLIADLQGELHASRFFSLLMNSELRNILKANVGRTVRIYFHGVGDGTYGSGVIKEVTNSILTFELRVREGTGLEYDTITYHDIGQIRTVTFHQYRATRTRVRSARKRKRVKS